MAAYFWIAVGSALGGVARYWCSGVVARLIGETFPFGTLMINVFGSFVIGFFATLIFKWTDQRRVGDINARALLLYDRFLFPISRALSRVFGRWLGKNLFVVAEKNPRAGTHPDAPPF